MPKYKFLPTKTEKKLFIRNKINLFESTPFCTKLIVLKQ